MGRHQRVGAGRRIREEGIVRLDPIITAWRRRLGTMNRVVVIVPTYNEADNVAALADAVATSCPDADILFVDDCSPDGTGKILDDMVGRVQQIHVLHRRAKKGLGRAYIAGFNWALERGYEWMVEMDADFSHDPQDVVRLLEASRGADLVLGSRYIGGIRIINWPMRRLILSKMASLYVRLITGMPFTDPTSGFRCFRATLLREIDMSAIRSDGYSFQIEMLHQAWLKGFRIVELPITFEERRSGESKMTRSVVYEAIWMVWRIVLRSGFRRRPAAVHPLRRAAQP